MITLDPKTTALVLIDLQNGILGRKLEPISAADLVERGKTLAGRFRAVGALVALVNARARDGRAATSRRRALDATQNPA